MIIRGMGIPETRMLHQPRHRATQLHPRSLRDHILDALAELQRPVLGRRLHGKVITEAQHRSPPVPVEVVHGTARADDEVILAPEGAQRRADLQVEVRVVAGVGGEEGCGRAAGGEHSNEDEVDVVDPVEVGVAADVEAFFCEHGDAARGRFEVWV